ncbi:MAG TPA: ADOP family duplicated permease [Rhodanobacteraceae bacterium]
MNIWLTEIWRAWRASVRKPGFLLLATGVLALGIGSTVAVFALVQNTLWRPLPVAQPNRLVVMGGLHDNGHVGGISPHEYQSLKSPAGFASMALVHFGMTVNVEGAGTPRRAPAIVMTRSALPTLGLHLVVGRNFNAGEDRPDGAPAVLLGYGLWQRAYAGSTHVIGQTLKVKGVSHTIVGVLPAAFNTLLGPGDVILPMQLPVVSHDYNNTGEVAIGRLKPGVSMATAAYEVDAQERTMFRDMGMGGNWKKPRFGAEPYAEAFQQDVRPMLLLFLGCAALVLLIALVNLANLMLLRALKRQHDVAVRQALGAPLGRLLLPALAEGWLIGACGALVGMVIAVVGLDVLQGFIPSLWLWGGSVQVGAAAWVLAIGMGLVCAIMAAALGVWRSRGVAATEALREGGRSGMGVVSGRLSRVLVTAQVALAAILLCAAGVFMHAIFVASHTPLGYVGNHVLTFEMSPTKARYPDQASLVSLSRRLVDRLRTIPGVTDAAVTTNLPTSTNLYGQFNNGMHTPQGKQFVAQLHGVGPHYLALFGIALRAGRGFVRADQHGSAAVAIVSQSLADRYYGGHALGQVVGVEVSNAPPVPTRIVGVVGNTLQRGPLHPVEPVVYLPLAQVPANTMAIFRHFEPLRFALRGHGNPADWRRAVHKVVAEVAPGQPIAKLCSMRSIVHKTTADARLNLLLIGVFAALALLLAAAGLYAVMAVAVAAREREFGVRMALGAAPSRLLRLVLRGGLLQVVAGLVIGVGGAVLAARPLSVLLMNLLGSRHALDPLVMAGVCVVLAIAGVLACLLPAIRAARVAPMHALRGE